MIYRYQVWIIPNGQLQASLAKTNAAEGLPGLNGMFSVKLRNIAGSQHTHNASAGWMSEAEVAYLMANLNLDFMVYEPNPGEAPESPLVTIERLGYAIYQEAA